MIINNYLLLLTNALLIEFIIGGLLFKAQPILVKDQYPAKAISTRVQCTTPFSPNLRTKARSMLRNSADSSLNSIITTESQNGRDSVKHAPSAVKTTTGITTKTLTSQSLDHVPSHHSTALTAAIRMM